MMKREIKFRGKIFNSGNWVDGYVLRWPDDTNYILVLDYDEESFIKYEVLAETVGQFTGVKDISGKDIYEGDIVMVAYNEYGGKISPNFIGKVNFQESGFYVDDGTAAFSVWQELAQWEVIGNMHDNPELLK